MRKIPYGKQSITEEDIARVVEVLKSDFMTQGPRIKEFEDAFAKYVGSKYAVAVNNGTVALHLACLALDCNSDTSVITSPITFVASANCVLYCGGKIDFCDIDSETFCLDLDLLENHLESGKQVDGVIPVHFAGYPVDMKRLKELSNKYNFWIIEDACHAIGASHTEIEDNHRVGSCFYSDMAVFSFHPVKHIACGEGGMVTTNDKKLYDRLNILRTHHMDKSENKEDEAWYYKVTALGFNYRITDMQAALGTSQLKRVEGNVRRRQEIADLYREKLKGLPVELPIEPKNGEHGYHLFVIRTKRRKELYNFLKECGIYAQIHYVPVHTQPLYNYSGELEVAEDYYSRCISLPMFHSLTNDDLDYVVDKIKEFYA